MMRVLYKQYGDAKRELVEKINEIAQELIRLKGSIAHAEEFAASLPCDPEEYKTSLIHHMNALSLTIKETNGEDSNSEEMDEQITDFNTRSLALSEDLESLDEIPNLDVEEIIFDTCLNDFEKFTKELPDDPTRRQVLVALREASTLLEEVNKGVTLMNENLALEVADVLTRGALVAAGLEITAVPRTMPY